MENNNNADLFRKNSAEENNPSPVKEILTLSPDVLIS
jgi:hypothetical protein